MTLKVAPDSVSEATSLLATRGLHASGPVAAEARVGSLRCARNAASYPTPRSDALRLLGHRLRGRVRGAPGQTGCSRGHATRWPRRPKAMAAEGPPVAHGQRLLLRKAADLSNDVATAQVRSCEIRRTSNSHRIFLTWRRRLSRVGH